MFASANKNGLAKHILRWAVQGSAPDGTRSTSNKRINKGGLEAAKAKAAKDKTKGTQPGPSTPEKGGSGGLLAVVLVLVVLALLLELMQASWQDHRRSGQSTFEGFTRLNKSNLA
jgi:uncharacterized protein HemX